MDYDCQGFIPYKIPARDDTNKQKEIITMKNDYPITIKEAKRIAKARIGRLPRAGYSVVVGGVFNGLPPTRRWDYQLSLVNYSGKFWLLEYTRPFSNVKPSDFQSIENETDGRE
jgi:hypothetical protein